MPDFMAGLMVFAVIISIFLFAWNSVVSDQSQFSAEDEMRSDAHYTTAFLVSTPGYPEDWNSSDVKIPGFATDDNIISDEKLKEFRDLSYSKKARLLEAQQFNLTFRNSSSIIDLDGQPLSFGRNYVEENPPTVVPVTRNVLVNKSGELVESEMEYVVWQ